MNHEPFANLLRTRLRQQWRFKALLGIVLTPLFCAGYFALQRFYLGEPRTMAQGAVDRWIGYSPGWVLIYQSMYLMMPLAWLAETRQQLWRFTAGFSLVSAVGFAWFFFDPVSGPRPAIETGGLLGLLQTYDSPLNSFPSLHMALASYAACFCLSVVGVRVWLAVALTVWVLLIGYATVATKQHYFIDVPAGVLLGLAAHRAATWLLADRSFTAAAAPVEELQ